MSILKYIDRLKRMDDLIQRKATGNAEEFASALGISVSVLKENLNEMRALGAEIEFSRIRRCYFYKNNCKLLIKFEPGELEMEDFLKIRGGRGLNQFFDRTILPDDIYLSFDQQSIGHLPRIPKSE